MTAVFEPGIEAPAPGEAVGDWHPARYTPTLSGTEDFSTDGDRLLRFVARHWSIAEAAVLTLDAWQEWLIRHVLETYPDDWPVRHLRGKLRYRQVVISMGRQNGKSLLASILAIYMLCLHKRGPRVIGLASIDRQAKIVYDRVRYAIGNSDALTREIKATGTRGITRRNGAGIYQTLPAKEDSAQGEPASGVIYDELHLGLAALWDAMLLAMRASEALMVGITTAGDDDSLLLIRLYEEGEAAIEGADERFGFFCWEAEDDELTESNVIRANPSIACGRVSLEVAMSDAAKMLKDTRKGPDGLTGPQRVKRYTLNRFIEGAADTALSVSAWRNTTGDVDHGPSVVYGIERDPTWEYAAVTASSLNEGRLHTELVASLVNPDHGLLLDVCKTLGRRGGNPAFALDSATLKELGKDLKALGYEAWVLGAAETQSAAAAAKSAIGRGLVVHPGDWLLRVQIPRARRRDVGDGWRISRTKSLGEIDGVLATVWGLYVAGLRAPEEPQVFI